VVVGFKKFGLVGARARGAQGRPGGSKACRMGCGWGKTGCHWGNPMKNRGVVRGGRKKGEKRVCQGRKVSEGAPRGR